MASTNIQVFSGDVETPRFTAENATVTQQLTVDDTLRITGGSSDPANFVDVSFQKEVGPYYLNGSKLQASDKQQDDRFGYSVAISEDGSTAIVGSIFEDATSGNGGAAYIFTLSGTTWSEQQKITGTQVFSGGSGVRFGHSVSISDDGNTVLVGSPGDGAGGGYAGAAHIFTRSGTTWSEQQKIQALDRSTSDEFGYSVSISKDSLTAIVGAPFEDVGSTATSHGSAYIFTRSGTTWSQQQKIQSTDIQQGDQFGQSVAINGDGNTVIVGVEREDTGGTSAGAAYIFTRSGTTWSQQQKIQASDKQQGDLYGHSVSISDDGNTAIVGANLEDFVSSGGGPDAGSAYVYTRSGTTWSQQTKLLASDRQQGDQFGISVAISGDGNKAIVGSSREDQYGTDAGAAYIYNRSGTTWSQQQKISASDRQVSDQFGMSVAISGNSITVIVGAAFEDTGGTSAGAAYTMAIPVYPRLYLTGGIRTANGSLLSFTGQHICFPEGPVERGLVVSANRNKFMNLNGPLSTGLSAIKSSESLPIVSLSNVMNDTNIFGVVDSVESASLLRTQRVGGTVIENKKESGDNRVIVNSLGEGAMWVVNTNGNISSGDYITTSNINGYGHKQDDDILHSYTVAKITMDCDFNPQELPIQVIKKDENGNNVLDKYGRLQWEDTDNTQKVYRIKYLKVDGNETDQANAVCTAAYVGCTYHCG
jgi:hypothetical protein|uniref:Uncharacterized protein n=1 Tax=viral metagenome TaxID=1070528 RepID=A0A6C0JDL8_9ZZZZ